MNRRAFLQTAAGAGLASALPSVSVAEGPSKPSTAEEAVAFQAGTPAVLRPLRTSDYFTQKALIQALGVETLKAPTDLEVVAYNFRAGIRALLWKRISAKAGPSSRRSKTPGRSFRTSVSQISAVGIL